MGQLEGSGQRRRYAAAVRVFDLTSGRTGKAWTVAMAPWQGWESGPDQVAIPPPPFHPQGRQTYFRDLRWSWDGRYLSFTKFEGWKPDGVTVLDSSTWREVVHIPDAQNAYVVPLAGDIALSP